MAWAVLTTTVTGAHVSQEKQPQQVGIHHLV
jgi:hypothetical protein